MSVKRVSKPYLSFNHNNTYFKQLNVKEIILDFIYNNVHFNMINKYSLDKTTLGLIDSLDYIVEPIINGVECLCIIMKNKNNYYSCLVEKEGLTTNKKDICINNVNIFNFDIKFSNLKIYDGTIFDGVYKYKSDYNNCDIDEFFIVNDIYYLNGENMINTKMTNKFSIFKSYLDIFGMGKFNILINNYLTLDDPDKILTLSNYELKNKNMSIDIKQSINGYRFYSIKTGKILNMYNNNNGQKIVSSNIKYNNTTPFKYTKQKVKVNDKSLVFYHDNNKLYLALPVEKSKTVEKIKSVPIFICDIEKCDIDNLDINTNAYLECRITNEGIIPFKYSLLKTPNKLSDLIELLQTE